MAPALGAICGRRCGVRVPLTAELLMMSLRPLLVSFLIFCCNSCAVSPPAPGAKASGESFLALGDSYTIGEGEVEAARWPIQLAALARQQGLAVQEPTIIARTGWTTAELQADIAAAHPASTYGLVSLLIGVNNQYRGQGVARYRPEFRELLRAAIGFAGGRPGRVVVLSIPDWGQSPFGQQQGGDVAAIGREIDQFNAVAQDECRQAGVAYVDITPLTRAAAPDRSQFTRDGLHYSRAQMRQWAERVLPVVQAQLQ
jgi:lysophospholipase L1-like esterase